MTWLKRGGIVVSLVVVAVTLATCGGAEELFQSVEERVATAQTPPTPPTYSVEYDGNGADLGSVPEDPNSYREGDVVTVSDRGSMGRTGQTFTGWNTEPDGLGMTYHGGDELEMRAEDLILYAQWSDNAYELTVSAGAGGRVLVPASGTINVVHGALTDIAAEPISGYEFDRWTVEVGEGVTIDEPALASTTVTLVSGAATVLATFYDDTPPNPPAVDGVSVTADTTPTWTWYSQGGGNGVYRWKLDSDDFTAGYQEGGVTTFVPQEPLSEGEHTLFVRERDDAGNWSSSGQHIIDIDIAAPVVPSPSDGGVSDGVTPLLDWENVANASRYRIQINTAQGFDGVSLADDDSLTISQYRVGVVLSHESDYYWRVRTRNTDGIWGAWGPIWGFEAEYTIGDTGPAGGTIFYDDRDAGSEIGRASCRERVSFTV